MASSHNVELEAAKFLHKLIQDVKDEPAKLATKLYLILQHMKSSGKENSMPYQVISRAVETVINQNGLDIEALMSSRLALIGNTQTGDSATQYTGSSQAAGVTKDSKSGLAENDMDKIDAFALSRPPVGPSGAGHDIYPGSVSHRSGKSFDHESPSSLDSRSANAQLQERRDTANCDKQVNQKDGKKASAERKRADSSMAMGPHTDNPQLYDTRNTLVNARKGKLMNNVEPQGSFSVKGGAMGKVQGGMPGGSSSFLARESGFSSSMPCNSSSYDNHGLVAEMHNERNMEAFSAVSSPSVELPASKSAVDSEHWKHAFMKGAVANATDKTVEAHLFSANRGEDVSTTLSTGKVVDHDGGIPNMLANANELVQALEYVTTLDNLDELLNSLDGTDDFANNVMDEVACDKIIVDEYSDVVRGDENEVKEKEKNKEPMVGMVFDSQEDCYQYYKSYGQQKGFPVMKRNIKRGDDGLVRWVTFACSRTRTRSTTKTNCIAKINIVLQPDLKFKLTAANLEHNHTLSPGKSRFFRCNKRLDSHVKRRLELNDEADIRLNKNFNSFVVEAGGDENLPFSEKDCRNYVDKARRSGLGKGDAEAIIDYFTRMREKEVGFFFRMDLDDDGRIRNVFWVDARSRATYEAFGDVVSFDMTYLTNKYDMPFAHFVGVNHHGHSVLLGCGLLSNEDIETFEWLFECWLSCMSWCPPKAFITDQCKAIQRAIENKFPDTRHRWCLWHIMKKIPEKLRGYSQYEAIKKALQTCVYDSFTKDGFEKGWKDMIEKYDLHANEWLGGLYNERHRWVPIYLKDTFFAGMSTTQRSESVNAFFDGYVNSKTTLKQFVEQFDDALRSKTEKENKADYHSFNARFECVTHFQIEKQFQEAYTNAKFKEFQDELLNGRLYCTISIDNEEGSIYRYKVNEYVELGDWNKDVVFDVYFNQRECEVQCTCQLFEFKGILCRHSLAVLTSKRVKQVPNKYILSRWRKDIDRKYTLIKSSYGDLRAKPRSKSYDKMFNGLMEVAAIAEGDEERCKFVIANTCQIKEQFLSSESVRGNNQPTALVTLIGSQNIENDNVELSQMSSKICSPLATRRKGQPPVNRKVSKTEVSVKRKKRIGQKREQKMRNSGSEETLPASSMLDIHNQDGTYGTEPINAFNLNTNPDEDGNG